MVWNKIIDKTIIDSFPKLKAIIRYGVGYENVDIVYASRKKIFVCNGPDYGIDEVSDTAVGMILNIARGLARYNQIMSNHLYDEWSGKFIKNIKRNSYLKLGVVGAGRIGSQVILKANFLKFHTMFFDPYKEVGYEKVLSSKRMGNLNELLSLSDIISFHVPLTNETRGMINSEIIKSIKPGASIVNTSRGKIFSDLDIVYDALKREKISFILLGRGISFLSQTIKLLVDLRTNKKVFIILNRITKKS